MFVSFVVGCGHFEGEGEEGEGGEGGVEVVSVLCSQCLRMCGFRKGI